MSSELQKELAKLDKINAEFNEAAKKAMPIIKSLSHTLANLLWAAKYDSHATIGGEGGRARIHSSAARNIRYYRHTSYPKKDGMTQVDDHIFLK